MGAAMAGSLLEAGHEVTVYNRTPSKAQGLIDPPREKAAQSHRMQPSCCPLSQKREQPSGLSGMAKFNHRAVEGRFERKESWT